MYSEFNTWAIQKLKPSQLSEARIFMLETRIKETEGNSIKETGFLKDIFKKLIYTMEQTYNKKPSTTSLFSKRNKSDYSSLKGSRPCTSHTDSRPTTAGITNTNI